MRVDGIPPPATPDAITAGMGKSANCQVAKPEERSMEINLPAPGPVACADRRAGRSAAAAAEPRNVRIPAYPGCRIVGVIGEAPVGRDGVAQCTGGVPAI